MNPPAPLPESAPRCLLVSGFLASPDAPSSGQKLVHETSVELARTHRVTLVTFENRLERGYFDPGAFPHAERVIRLPVRLRHRLLALFLFPWLPGSVAPRALAGRRVVRDLLRRNRFDLVRVEFFQAAAVLPRRERARAELVEHDVWSQSLERRAAAASPGPKRWALRAELRAVRGWEAAALREFARIIVLNRKDARLVRELSGRDDAVVAYPKLGAYLQGVRRTPDKVCPGTILFWGHMAREENVDAVRWFADEIFPRVRAAVPDAGFVIAGADPAPRVRELAERPGIVVTGFLADPVPWFERAAVAVAPLRLGGGIKIKTLEAISVGLPVVATEVGAEGVEDNGLLHLAATAPEIASRVTEILRRPPVCAVPA
jgi:glycosyltransferase involved in cell wall biosynthesis